MSSWYTGNPPEGDIVISSRIRLARNLKGLPFPSRMTDEQRHELCEKVKSAITESNTPFAKSLKYISLKDIPKNEALAMVERHIVSPEFVDDTRERAVILSQDESICIMIGEEDHVRIQVLYGGLQLEKAYDVAEQLDTLLCDALNFAFDEQLGFLTECPTNLGTGLRASVMLHLPVIEGEGQVATLSDSINKIGFTVRGMYGEGSRAKASMYQISNQITLGISEKNAIDNLKIITVQLIDKERKAREQLNRLAVEDLCMRAYGTLSNARILSSEEMMKLLCEIKLGQSMGIIDNKVPAMKVFIECQPYMLMRRFGHLEAGERDINRANAVREAFSK